MTDAPPSRQIDLPDRGGAMSILDMGREDRPVDIVFSHATGFNARSYRTVLAPLAAEFHIVAIDIRGHGASTLPTDQAVWPGWDGLAQDLVAFLARVADGPVVLAGHSLGATTSLLAAGLAPQAVRGLALFEPVLPDDVGAAHQMSESAVKAALRRRSTFENRSAALEAYRGRGVLAALSEAQLQDYVAAGFHDTAGGEVTLACPPEVEALIYARQDYDPWAALDKVRCPVQLVASEEGSGVGGRARAEAGRLGVRLQVVPESGHMLPLQCPETVRAVLRDLARETAHAVQG